MIKKKTQLVILAFLLLISSKSFANDLDEIPIINVYDNLDEIPVIEGSTFIPANEKVTSIPSSDGIISPPSIISPYWWTDTEVKTTTKFVTALGEPSGQGTWGFKGASHLSWTDGSWPSVSVTAAYPIGRYSFSVGLGSAKAGNVGASKPTLGTKYWYKLNIRKNYAIHQSIVYGRYAGTGKVEMIGSPSYRKEYLGVELIMIQTKSN